MSQALYRKWRPQKWDEVVSQEHIIQTLKNAVMTGRVGHAYIFAGSRGTGKTTAARLLAKAVNCLAEDAALRPCNECANCKAVNENRFMDLIEIDAASNTGVDDVRDLRDKINFTPTQGKYKIYLIDEVHMLSTQAFNALLKTLEEPPPYIIFILATTEIQKIPATVLSRCQRHEFRRLPVSEITGQLKKICEQEGLEAEDDALSVIARQSAGGMRDAISLLDQLSSTGQKITVAMTQTVLGTATSQTVLGLVDAIRDNDPAKGMNAIHQALDGGSDARALARQIVDYLRNVMMFQMGNGTQVEAPQEVRTQMGQHATNFSSAQLLRLIKSFNQAATDLRGGWQPSLPLELALAEVLGTPVEAAAQAVKAQPPQVLYQEADKRVEKPAETRPGVKAVMEEPAKPESGKQVPEAAGGKPGVTLEQISQGWKQIKQAVKSKSPSLEGLLNSCKLVEMKDGMLVLGFESDIVRSKADKPEQMEITCKAIKELTGVEVPVKCVVTNMKKNAPADVKADGMVAAALKAGGEIVDVQD